MSAMVLYHGPGATDYDCGSPVLSADQWGRIRASAIRLLRARGALESADFLERYPFELLNGTNGFGDEFQILYVSVGLNDYVALSEWHHQADNRHVAWGIAKALDEVGFSVRIIAADLRQDEGVQPVSSPLLRSPSAVVEQALDDAQHLLAANGPVSAVDRVHTALHGYLRDLATSGGMNSNEASGASLQRLLSWLCTDHPRLAGPESDETRRILRSFGGVVESLSHFRNNSSLAHPNASLLGEAEAMLAINAVRTILHYVAEKLS